MTYETAKQEYRAARFTLDWAQGVLFTAESTGEWSHELEQTYKGFDRAYNAATEELNWYSENESHWSDEQDAPR